MREDLLDLWEAPCDARCITTNGTVKANGRAVMGRGCAKEATLRYFALELTLGTLLKRYGNQVLVITRPDEDPTGVPLVSFPVKHEWHQRADLVLIAQSATQLVELTDAKGWQTVVLPRPGCGNGHRKWSEVRPVIQPILDDRFTVVTL